MQFVTPQPFSEAVQKLGSRSPIGSTLNSAEWRDVPLALRERAFFSSEIENVRFLQRAKDLLADFQSGAREVLPDGQTALKVGSRADFVKQLREFTIAEGMGPLRPQDKGTLKDITSSRRLGLIFETNLRAANQYGNWKQGQAPDVLWWFPAQRFIREAEVAVKRPLHWQNEDEVRLKSDLGFWLAMNSPLLGGFGVPWGPWGFGSGMGVEDVNRPEAERLGLLKPGEAPTPVEAEFNEKLKASVQTLSPEIERFLKDRLGDRIQIRNGEAQWNPEGALPERPISPAPATPAPQPAAPAPEPSNLPAKERSARDLDRALERAGVKGKDRVTAQDIAALRRELKKPDAATSADVVRRVAIATKSTALDEAQIRVWTDDFLGYFPPDLVRSLPPLTIGVRPLGGDGGTYNPGGIVNLASNLDPDEARRNLFHELMHWVHREGPAWYRDLVREHYAARTAGEPEIELPGYRRGTRGKRDRWSNVYAGRIYPFERGEAQGIEVPTVYFEQLTESNADLARSWNDPVFRETMLVVLRALF